MSSFIIEKTEYIKCAGLLYGYEQAQRDSHLYYMERLYDWFVRCYELNVTSVNEQYNDNSVCDDKKYLDLFEEYKERGYDWYITKSIPIFLKAIMSFFRSVSYQVENEEMAKEIHNIFYICLSHILPRCEGNWGSIDI